MGLDIRGYNKTIEYTPVDTGDADADCDINWNNATYFEAHYPEFSKTYEGLEDGKWYQRTDATFDEHWTYMGWNKFRETLANFQGVPVNYFWTGKATAELSFLLCDIIHFTDCDGVIGPKSVKRIAKDFRSGYDRYMYWVDNHCKDGDYLIKAYKQSYKTLTEGFEKTAKDGGFVVFS